MIRLLLVVSCLLLLGVGIVGLRVGWLRRGRSQAGLPPLPVAPDLGEALLPALRGLYVGTTFAGSWQDRVVHAGLGARADAQATMHGAGVLISRSGAAPIFIPADALVEARLAPGLAGKVVGAGGLLVIRWRLGAVLVDTGLRADDKTGYPDWVSALTSAARAGGRAR